MLLWRVILEKICTLTEAETTVSMDDIMRANAMLDMRDVMSDVLYKVEK